MYSVNSARCTVHSVHSVQCTRNTVHCSQNTQQWILQAARLTLKTAHFTQDTKQWTLPTSQCKLHTVHRTLNTTHCILHSKHCTLHIANGKLNTAHCTLHTTFWQGLYIIRFWFLFWTLQTTHCTSTQLTSKSASVHQTNALYYALTKQPQCILAPNQTKKNFIWATLGPLECVLFSSTITIPWVKVNTMGVVNTISLFPNHESLPIPWDNVYTMSPCQNHESMSIPWVPVCTMSLFQIHASISIPWEIQFSDIQKYKPQK